VFAVDHSESQLGILDLIQVFVESLDSCFKNVCELDIIFNSEVGGWVGCGFQKYSACGVSGFLCFPGGGGGCGGVWWWWAVCAAAAVVAAAAAAAAAAVVVVVIVVVVVACRVHGLSRRRRESRARPKPQRRCIIRPETQQRQQTNTSAATTTTTQQTVHNVLDEMVMGGMVLETSAESINAAIRDMQKLEEFSDKKVAADKASRQADSGGRKF
jgi:hypothetical protein